MKTNFAIFAYLWRTRPVYLLRMTRLVLPLLLVLLMSGCGAKKRSSQTEARQVHVAASPEETGEEAIEVTEGTEEENPMESGYEISPGTIESIIDTALEYSGVRYQYGGTSRKGMDCSGLLYVAFKSHDITLPRVSHEMAEEGRRIRVNEISKGDLLFFTTTRRGRKINHVGLVVEVKDDDVRFIHSTTSRGVIVSSLREGFWNHSFVKATRVL